MMPLLLLLLLMVIDIFQRLELPQCNDKHMKRTVKHLS